MSSRSQVVGKLRLILDAHRKKSIATILFLGCIAILYWVDRAKYPYGHSHSCILQLRSPLMEYAEEHDGNFPAGEASPEASLSLVVLTQPLGGELLRGKTVPRRKVDAILASGGLLAPETCGWHYVEGLRTNDDPRIAIVWDKVGLGHNGEDIGFHEVLFLDGSREFVAKSRWENFLAEQAELRADSARARSQRGSVLRATLSSSTGSVTRGGGMDTPFRLFIRTHESLDRAAFVQRSFRKAPTETGFKLARQGPKLTPASLTWHVDEVPREGAWELVLVVEGYDTWEAVVIFRDGIPDHPSIGFEINRPAVR